MSVESDKLREMINEAPEEVTNLDNTIESLNERITEEQEKQNALEFVMSSSITDLNTFLPTKGDYVYKFGGYGTTNATDWYVCTIILDNDDVDPNNDITYVADDEFECDDDLTVTFDVDDIVVFNQGVDGETQSTVKTSVFNLGVTTVTLNDNVLTANVEKAMIPSYVYEGIGWDSDADIQSRINEFYFAYDYKTQPLGTGGSYGTADNISNMNTGKTIITNNRNKINNSITQLERYATPA